MWLDNILNETRSLNKKAMIVNHFPIRSHEMAKYYSNHLQQIFIKYSDVITAFLSGHYHKSGFKIIFNDQKPILINYISGSIKPDAGNPSFRLYYYNRTYNI